MKKGKLLKTLAAISLSAVAAAGCISLAACGHQHSTIHGWEKDSTNHWHVCDEDGEKFDEAAHTYVDGECSVCGKAENADVGEPSGEPGGETVSDAHEFSWDALRAVIAERCTGFVYDETTSSNSTDKVALEANDFTGVNSFLTFVEDGKSSSDQYRSNKNGSCIEVKGDRLKVTFQKAGTITITFGSTSGANTSGLVLAKADGTWLEATATTATKVEADETIAEGYVNKAGLYKKEGGQNSGAAASITFTVEAGTYTIHTGYSYYDDSKSTNSTRGTRIYTIVMANT